MDNIKPTIKIVSVESKFLGFLKLVTYEAIKETTTNISFDIYKMKKGETLSFVCFFKKFYVGAKYSLKEIFYLAGHKHAEPKIVQCIR